MLDTRSEDYHELREHLRRCQYCREFSENIETWQTLCEESLGYRWPRIPVGRRSRELLAQEVQNYRGNSSSPFLTSLPVRQIGYLVLIAGIVATLFWSANQYLPEEPAVFTQPTQRPAPTKMSLPTPVGETPSRPANQGFGNREPDIRVDFNLQPAISGDGRWIAYTMVKAGLNEDVSDNQPGVFLYDQVEDVRELVSVTNQGELPNEFSYSPGISDDGQRIVFASAASNLSTIPRGCQENINFDCMDIYLRDRSQGTTERISVTDSGGAPNGPSFSPLISADGTKVYFWSTATNLITESTPICEPIASDSICRVSVCIRF